MPSWPSAPRCGGSWRLKGLPLIPLPGPSPRKRGEGGGSRMRGNCQLRRRRGCETLVPPLVFPLREDPLPYRSGSAHVAQYLRSPFPRHHLGRKPWSGAWLRGGWLPARHPLHAGRTSGLARQAQARPVAFRDAAPRGRPREGALRRDDGRGRRDDDHHRHARVDDDREHRPALQGLWRDRQALSPRPCRLHL
jgi:hypothetical protein